MAQTKQATPPSAAAGSAAAGSTAAGSTAAGSAAGSATGAGSGSGAAAKPADKPADKPVKPAEATAAYLKQEKYTYCDVKILGEYWKTPAKDAKARAGAKLVANDTSTLDKELDHARGQTKLKCTYLEGGFTMRDVKKLSQLWHLSIAEAKSTIELKLMHGTSIYLKQEIRGTESGAIDKDFDAFASQTKYTYCDAKMIGTLWGKSAMEGKTAIGAKLNAKKNGALAKLVAEARKNAVKNVDARCQSYEAGFSYDDMVLLAALWKKDASEVKATLIGDKIAHGLEAQIRAQLKKEKAKAPKPKPVDPTMTPANPPASLPKPEGHQGADPGPMKKPATKQAVPEGTKQDSAPTKAAPPAGADAPTQKPVLKPAATK
jgi:hypothetical protein